MALTHKSIPSMNNQNFSFSKRTDWPLSINQLTLTLEKFRKDNIPYLDLTQSNPTHCQFAYSHKKILNPLTNKNNLNYSPSPQGLIEAREVLCAYYKQKNLKVSADQIFLTSGTSEAYTYLFRLLTNSDERVLLPSPSYPLFPFLVDINDIGHDYYPLSYNGQWSIDFNSLKKALHPNTKIIILVNPNNPTGSYIKKNELLELNTLCRENNMALLSDEVFYDFGLSQPKDAISLVQNDSVLTFTLGGLSKTLGLPQMKCSWIIMNGPKNLVKQAHDRLEIIADTYLSINTPVQNALKDWLPLKNNIQTQIKLRIHNNLNILKEITRNSSHCELLNVEGGWYAILKIPSHLSEEDWVLDFLTKDRVLVHPGYFFEFDHDAHIVLSCLPPPDVFEQGVKMIIKRIASKN